MSLVIREAAAEDARRITDSIHSHRPRIAVQFANRLTQMFGLIESFPHLGSRFPASLQLDPALRFMTLRKFRRTVIVYLPKNGGVEICRVLEGSQDLMTVLATM